MDSNDIPFSHLFLAVPELMLDEALMAWVKSQGLITEEGTQALNRLLRNKTKVEKIIRKTRGKSAFEKLMGVAPELLTNDTVNLLRRFDYIDTSQGHMLRLAIRSIGAIKGGKDSDDIVKRAARLFGVGFSEETVNLLRSMGMISEADGRQIRALINAGEATVTIGRKALRAKTLVDWLMLGGSSLVDSNVLRTLRLTGVINARTANAMIEAARYGSAQWTVWEGARKADGLAARMAYVLSGSFSWEGVDFLKSIGVMNPKYEGLLKVAVGLSQDYNRHLMEQLTRRRYRINPGESPIKSFARASKKESGDILQLLAETSREASRDARKMKGLSASQRKIRAASIHMSMREMWEGIGHLTIFGERRTSEAAAEAMMDMQKVFTRHLPEDVVRMMNMQAKAGIDAYVSRQENRKALSHRVYNNLALMNGKIDKRINIHLLKGSSADEIARDIARFISPRTPGGVAYAAMRLGRTELANAFHTTTIRHGREMPWISGFKWNLSGSHGRPDICNKYAEDDHDNLGAGVFKKANVPDKPHPQCLCYLTMHQVDESVFIKNMKRGYYNSYMTQMMGAEEVVTTMGERRTAAARQAMADYVLPIAATAFMKSRVS